MSVFTIRSWKPFDSELNSSCWVEVYSLAATTKSKKQTASSHPAFPLSSHLLFPNSFVMCISLWAHSRLANSCLTNQCSGQRESTLKPSFKRNECLSLAWWEHIQNIPLGRITEVAGASVNGITHRFSPFPGREVRAMFWPLSETCITNMVLVCSVETISSHHIPEKHVVLQWAFS